MATISCFHTFWSDSKCFTARSTWMVTFPNIHQSVWLNPFSVQKFLHKTNKGYISNFKFSFSWFWCDPFYHEFNRYIELEKFNRKLSSTGDDSMIITEVVCKLKSPSGIFTTFPTSEMNDNVFPRVSWSLFLAIVVHNICKSQKMQEHGLQSQWSSIVCVSFPLDKRCLVTKFAWMVLPFSWLFMPPLSVIIFQHSKFLKKNLHLNIWNITWGLCLSTICLLIFHLVLFWNNRKVLTVWLWKQTSLSEFLDWLFSRQLEIFCSRLESPVGNNIDPPPRN